MTQAGYLRLIALLLPLTLAGALIPEQPTQDVEVRLLSEQQRRIIALPNQAARLAALTADKTGKRFYFAKDAVWNRALPVTFSWRCTEGEKPPFRLTISEHPDFRDPILVFADTNPFTITPADTNFKIGCRYYWKVSRRAESGRPAVESAAATFVTEDLPPRWIVLYGLVRNVRDFGGVRTVDGRRIRQNMAVRGEGLNQNSPDGTVPGPNRLMVRDAEYLLGTLKIRTDLELRKDRETAGMTVSPLGPQVKFIQHDHPYGSPYYRGIFTEDGRKVMAKNVRVFCDRENYPIYFHCIAGADRTGSLAFILAGALGVSEEDLILGWEQRFLPNMPELQANGDPKYWRLSRHLLDGLQKYGKPGDTINRRIELYLYDCGITPAELAALREILLEDAPKR